MRKVQRAHWSNSIGIREKLADIRRPLLCITKREIVKFATENQIKWIEDPTNADNSFLRNRVRNIELPVLKCEQIDYVNHLLHEQERNFNRLEGILNKIKSTNFKYKKHSFGISINYKLYFNFDSVGQKLIIQHFILNYIDRELVRHSKNAWENLSAYLLSKKKRSSLFKLTNNLSIYRSSKRIYIIFHDDLKYRELIMDGNCEWYGGRIESTTLYSFKKYSDKLKVSLPLNSHYKIRQWKRRDSFILATNGHKRKVSDLFIDHKLDYIQKKTQPIITKRRGKILWIPGLAHAKIDKSDKFEQYSWKPQVC
jgi:tRNA(Ile)-lysidine synthase